MRILYLQETFKPAKFFSIDRVFRNENLYATHLAEFHQIEGLVADYGMSLGDLMGIIYEFFKKLGKFKVSKVEKMLWLSRACGIILNFLATCFSFMAVFLILYIYFGNCMSFTFWFHFGLSVSLFEQREN